MADTKAGDVPANQKVETVLRTITDDSFAQKASSLLPQLHSWIENPRSVITFQPDPTAFFKCKPIPTQSISEFFQTSYGRGDQVILDFGSHRVGYLSFHLGVEGVNVDAPARLRLTFGEIPYDVTENLHPCKTWISTSWLPDEIINFDWLPSDVEMPRRYSFRYLKIEVLDTSPKYKVRFQDVSVRAVGAVSPHLAASVPKLEVEDRELVEIDRISQVTLRDCMQTVFEDGPRRDRRLWLGDLRLQALANYPYVQRL